MDVTIYDALGQPKNAVQAPEFEFGEEVGYASSTTALSTGSISNGGTLSGALLSMTIEGDGVNPTILEAFSYSPYIASGGGGGGYYVVGMYEGSTSCGLAQYGLATVGVAHGPLKVQYRLAPFTGSKTISLKVANSLAASAVVIVQGSSGSPVFIRATRLKRAGTFANPTVKVYNPLISGAAQIANATEAAIDNWQTEEWDTHSMHSSTNPGRLYAPAAGAYSLDFVFDLAADTSVSNMIQYAWYRINGGSKYFLPALLGAGSISISVRNIVAFHDTVKLNAGDYIEVGGYQSSGATLAFTTGVNGTRATLTYQGPVYSTQSSVVETPVKGIIVPNATLGTNRTQTTTGSSWVRMYGTASGGLLKEGDYFSGATLVNHADGAQYIQIEQAGMYIFMVNHSLGLPSCSEVGYGLTTKAEFDGGVMYRDVHNHEKPYSSTADYKARTFMRYCSVGDLVTPTIYFNGATGTVTFNNQTTTRCSFSFVRVSE